MCAQPSALSAQTRLDPGFMSAPLAAQVLHLLSQMILPSARRPQPALWRAVQPCRRRSNGWRQRH
jgi:hypothetical protein